MFRTGRHLHLGMQWRVQMTRAEFGRIEARSFCLTNEVQFFLENLHFNFSKTCVRHLHKTGSDMRRALVAYLLGDERYEIFNDLLFF